jgi:hypothetical protein
MRVSSGVLAADRPSAGVLRVLAALSGLLGTAAAQSDAGDPSRLASPRYAEREAASAALIQRGSDAYARAREALDSDDPEVRWRAEELIEALEARSLREPTRLEGLDEAVPREDLLRLLERAAGVRFRAQADSGATLAAGFDQPPTFWEALDALGLDAAWAVDSDPRRSATPLDPVWRLVERDPMPPDALAGPYRLVVRELADEPEPGGARARGRAPVERPSARDLLLRLDLQSEPRLRFRLVEPIRLLAATDRDGRITHVEAEPVEPEFRLGESLPFGWAASQTLRLHPIRAAGPPARLILRARVEGEARRADPTVVPLETTATSAVLPRPARLDDATISSLRIDRPPGVPGLALDITIQPDDLAEFFARRRFGRQRFDVFNQMLDRPMRQFDLVDADGQIVRFDASRRVVPAAQGFRMVATLDLPPGAPPPPTLRLYTSARAVSDWTFTIEAPAGP